MDKCLNCGHTVLKEAFLGEDKGILHYIEGKPSMVNQLFGKRKKLNVKVCENCGHLKIFGK